MAPKYYVLSASAMQQLSRLQADVRDLKKQLVSLGRITDSPAQNYLVLTPEAGIPAMASGVPGEAVCTISRRWGPADPKEIDDTARETKVYNATSTQVAGESLVVVHRDFLGDLYVSNPGSSRGIVFPIALSQTGGSDGTTSASASWTYTVTDALTSETLATGVNPSTSPHKFKRPSVGKMHVATFGYAHYNGSELTVGWINEYINASEC